MFVRVAVGVFVGTAVGEIGVAVRVAVFVDATVADGSGVALGGTAVLVRVAVGVLVGTAVGGIGVDVRVAVLVD